MFSAIPRPIENKTGNLPYIPPITSVKIPTRRRFIEVCPKTFAKILHLLPSQIWDEKHLAVPPAAAWHTSEIPKKNCVSPIDEAARKSTSNQSKRKSRFCDTETTIRIPGKQIVCGPN